MYGTCLRTRIQHSPSTSNNSLHDSQRNAEAAYLIEDIALDPKINVDGYIQRSNNYEVAVFLAPSVRRANRLMKSCRILANKFKDNVKLTDAIFDDILDCHAKDYRN